MRQVRQSGARNQGRTAARIPGHSIGSPGPGPDGSERGPAVPGPSSRIRGWLGGAALVWALAVIPAGPSAAASPWPFEGVWDCEVGTFTFTDSTYDSGEAPMPIVDIAPEGDTFTLTFEDNYQLSLAMNPDGTMTWFSPVSGDSFLCRRMP